MIVTQAQYEIARDRIRRFNEALSDLAAHDPSWLRDLQMRDIRDQIGVLEDDLARYDNLTSGEVEEIVVDRLADLPQALIQGRIVAGLTQAELARETRQSLLKIQQWERDGYSRVPVSVMQRIASVLPVTMRGRARVQMDAPLRPPLRTLLTQAGLPREVYDDVILPSRYEGIARDDEIDRRLERLFGHGAAEFVGGRGFAPVPLRFKLPANAEQERTRAYAAYVEGVCTIVAATQPRRTADLPTSWRDMRSLLFPEDAVDLRTAVRQCWSLGIGVIGLRDKVAFHGAARRIDGRATAVLKPSSRHASRWLFNLVHEIFHIVSEPEDFTLIEGNETSRERREALSERRANRYAAMVLTNGSLADAFAMIARRAEGSVARLSAVVRETANIYRIPVGILANLVADDVQATSGINWWGTAENLQPPGDDPWKIVRDVFIEEADFHTLGSTEAAVLRQILETRDE
ncbi:helix-turn-helix transcriptional regulator [Methylobacterium sp. NEAU K]|uniref:helix-turn-helix transcriptional regulator n=1 Tax=Methylobacterium sp. NEAU K TaxID=3064946 RepID=UPI002735EF90|nr:helix-turn-helix transcriptional regulator [Methylobacterium sp. NEAU K]MDP4006389.1 helix-turn-helix transcriptional regulator [Methylobacterium sp. NEAU K]